MHYGVFTDRSSAYETGRRSIRSGKSTSGTPCRPAPRLPSRPKSLQEEPMYNRMARSILIAITFLWFGAAVGQPAVAAADNRPEIIHIDDGREIQ